MAEPRRPRIPDPSATIPDFGPRPDLKTLEKRDEVLRMLRSGEPPEPPAPRRMNPAIVLGVALVVALIAGTLGFVVMVTAGALLFMVLGV